MAPEKCRGETKSVRLVFSHWNGPRVTLTGGELSPLSLDTRRGNRYVIPGLSIRGDCPVHHRHLYSLTFPEFTRLSDETQVASMLWHCRNRFRNVENEAWLPAWLPAGPSGSDWIAYTARQQWPMQPGWVGNHCDTAARRCLHSGALLLTTAHTRAHTHVHRGGG